MHSFKNGNFKNIYSLKMYFSLVRSLIQLLKSHFKNKNKFYLIENK